MDPISTATILKGIYGACGLFCAWHGYKLQQIKYYLLNFKKLPEDHEDVKAVKRHFTCWSIPVWVAVILLLIT
jgi:hypothetical protein